MAIRMIRLDGDELLRKTSKPVKEITQNVLTLLDDMAETMYGRDGVGLAAPQVGILKRVVVIDIRDDKGILELINPEVIETRGTQNRREGCLSLPGRAGVVERPVYVKVKALGRDGQEIVVEGEELMAVALCHEIDHLDGVLFTDKAVSMEGEDDDAEDGEYDEYDDEAAE